EAGGEKGTPGGAMAYSFLHEELHKHLERYDLYLLLLQLMHNFLFIEFYFCWIDIITSAQFTILREELGGGGMDERRTCKTKVLNGSMSDARVKAVTGHRGPDPDHPEVGDRQQQQISPVQSMIMGKHVSRQFMHVGNMYVVSLSSFMHAYDKEIIKTRQRVGIIFSSK
ncbi:hypothetical protein ACJX0J_024968, partial [Zea mays]